MIAALSLPLAAALLAAAPPLPEARVQTTPPPPIAARASDTTRAVDNPFSGFETHHLANGVKVWFRRLPGAPNASVSVAVPYGSDQDPPGREELAHFTEHMLFGDHAGRTEQEIKDEIEARGGRRNGYTFADRTFYYVTIPREHGLLALDWLGRIVEPHAMDAVTVERNRQPVANEVRARPREIGDWILAALDPAWLRMPGFWEREFGLDTRSDRRWDRWAHLRAIGPDDLRGFYDRYYAPGAMTVTVVGDLSRDSVLAVAGRAFGDLEPRPVAEGYGPPADPGRYRRTVAWTFDASPRYRTIFKLFQPTAEDHVRLLFVRDLLARRLEDRLRFGERKAVYGVSVQAVERGPVKYLAIEGSVDEEDLGWARDVIEEELDVLRGRGSDAAGDADVHDRAFESDRRAVIEQLASSNRTAEDVNFQVLGRFYDRRLHDDFPDLVTAWSTLDRAEVTAFAREHLEAERRVEWIWRPHPAGQAGVAAGIFLLALLAVRGAGRLLTTPVEMARIRYVARIRMSLPFTVAVVAVYGAGALALFRLLIAAVERLMYHRVAPLDSYLLQMGVIAALGCASIGLLVGYLSLLPRKILVFPDHVRIKYLAYRSRLVRPEDVRELSLRRFSSVWLSRRMLRTLPFTTGLLRPGIYLETRGAAAVFFRVRDVDGLFRAMETVLAGEVVEPETAPAG